MTRNYAIDVAKGFAIICVVIAHAEMPGMLNRAIYLFHMPLFFIAAGYFFAPGKVCADPWSFVCRRFKKLYIPFIKWSLFFLLIHNLLFKIGILNETYGNWSGGVTHPYPLDDFDQRIANILFSMGGYDEFLAGAFWFFRALLVASIAFMVCFLLLNSTRRLNGKHGRIGLLIAVGALALAALKVGLGWKIATLVQGGYRDIIGTMFFAVGFLYRRYEGNISHSMWLSLAGCLVVLAGSWLECAGMTLSPHLRDAFTILVTGTAGWLMTYNAACWLTSRANPRWWRWLSVCGELSLYIFIWHVSAYKVVSVIKIWWYGLDWAQIGCHMVIHDHAADDLFWILYTIAGVGIPVLGVKLWRMAASRVRPLAAPSVD